MGSNGKMTSFTVNNDISSVVEIGYCRTISSVSSANLSFAANSGYSPYGTQLSGVNPGLSDGISTISTVYGPFPDKIRRKHRVSILKKLREKLDVVPSASSSNRRRRPLTTVVKVQGGGANSDALSDAAVSSGGSLSSTLRSWRLVDDFLAARRRRREGGCGGASVNGRAPAVQMLAAPPSTTATTQRSGSALSGKTIIYDDRALNVDKPTFCTVVNVGSTTAMPRKNERRRLTVASLACENANNRISCASPAVVTPSQVLVCPDDDDVGLHAQQCPAAVVNDAGTGRQRRYRLATPSSGCVEGVRLTGWRVRSELHQEPPAANQAVLTASHHTSVTDWRMCTDSNAEPLEGGGTTSATLNQGRVDVSTLNALAVDDLPRIFSSGSWPLLPPAGGVGGRLDEEEPCDEPKGCCGNSRISHSLLIRVFIALISLIGLSCVIVGVVLGALTVSGSTRLTLCLLMIGVGVVLMIVSCIAWRLTSLDPAASSSCCRIMGFRSVWNSQSILSDQNHLTTSYYRVRNHRRAPIPFMTSLPPEFIWRPPPPTYQATVQEMRLQNIFGTRRMQQNLVNPAPTGLPPPTYRLNTDATLEAPQRPSLNEFVNQNSRPPSYSTNTILQAGENISQMTAQFPMHRPISPQNFRSTENLRTQTTEMLNIPALNSTRSRQNLSSTNQNADDDRAILLRNDFLAQQIISNDQRNTACEEQTANLSENVDQSRDEETEEMDTTSVIDCSEAVPVVKRGSASDPRPTNQKNPKMCKKHHGPSENSRNTGDILAASPGPSNGGSARGPFLFTPGGISAIPSTRMTRGHDHGLPVHLQQIQPHFAPFAGPFPCHMPRFVRGSVDPHLRFLSGFTGSFGGPDGLLRRPMSPFHGSPMNSLSSQPRVATSIGGYPLAPQPEPRGGGGPPLFIGPPILAGHRSWQFRPATMDPRRASSSVENSSERFTSPSYV